MPDDSYLLAGTHVGELKMFTLGMGQHEESTYNCHESTLYHLQPSKDCSMLLTSRCRVCRMLSLHTFLFSCLSIQSLIFFSSWRTPYSCLWSLGQWFEQKMSFREDEYVEFSKLKQDMVSKC